MALAHFRAVQELLPKCSASGFTSEAPCIEYPGRGSVFIHTSDPICLSDITLPGINALPQWLLAVAYLLLICYLFLGVSLVADLFCDGIVEITSTKRVVRRRNDQGEMVEVEEPVWNWVVANITLMALGTSAPEILLATVEALLNLGKPAGVLGPACIVGSAAYNFLMITAVCTLVVPTGQFKGVTELRVYITTAAWSIFAYIWMLVVYSWWTPNRVTILEALLTLMFFVLLVSSAYAVDVRLWKARVIAIPTDRKQLERASGEAAVATELGEVGRDLEAAAAAQRTRTAAATGRASREFRRVSRTFPRQSSGHIRSLLYYRLIVDARTGIVLRHGHSMQVPQLPGTVPASGGGGTGDGVRGEDDGTGGDGGGTSVAVIMRHQAIASQVRDLEAKVRALKEPHLAQVAFRSSAYSCLESSGTARITVVRTGGDLSLPLQVHYETQDGDAIAGLDYKPVHGTINLVPDEVARTLEIKILDDDATEPDVSFWVVLSISTASRCPYIIMQERVRVTIVDDDHAGILSFELPAVEAVYRPWHPWAEVMVVRRGGQDGQVQVAYETEDDTAMAGKDYVDANGILTFQSGEKTQTIHVELLPVRCFSRLQTAVTPANSLMGSAHGTNPIRAAPSATTANSNGAMSPTAAGSAAVVTGPMSFRLRMLDPSGGAVLGCRSTATVTLTATDTEYREDQEVATAKLRLLEIRRRTASMAHYSKGAENSRAGGTAALDNDYGKDSAEVMPGIALPPLSSSFERRRIATPTTATTATATTTLVTTTATAARADAAVPESIKAEEFDLWIAYKEQFYSAFSVPQAEEGEAPPGLGKHLLHFSSMFFKVLFAVLVPPAAWKGGYPCFFCALAMIVTLVYILERASYLLGCVTGLSEFMVGISLVAVGTSLPDTFASMMAARTDPNADAAVGNITGSNSVNVFLGLGLPWTISSVYNAVRGQSFEAPAGDLGFAVGLFAIFFAIAITIQFVRRYQGGELGGGRTGKLLVAGTFIVLWLLYLILSGLRSTGNLKL